MFICSTCHKSFKSELALRGHTRIHSPKNDSSIIQRGLQCSERALNRYQNNPKICTYCKTMIPYKQFQQNRNIKFCNQSCAASFNNMLRPPRSIESRNKTSNTLLKIHSIKPKIIKQPKLKHLPENAEICNMVPNVVEGPFTKIYYNKCKHCDTIFLYCSRIKYCLLHTDQYKNNNRNRYAFTFSLSKHPNLFSQYSTLLKQYGIWSYSNTNGLTRDHRISVNDAIKNNYDPYYIKHPINCELMSWSENNKKKSKSSMSYSELIHLVDQYDQSYVAPGVGSDPTIRS